MRVVIRLFLLLSFGAAPTVGSAKTDFWTRLGLSGERVTAMAVAPASPGTIYAGTLSGGLFQIVDREQKKLVDHLGSGSNAVTAIAVDPQNSAVLIAATADGVFRTSDTGMHWSAVDATIVGCVALTIDAQDPKIIYAGSSSAGVYKSIDGGTSWIRTALTGSVQAVAIDPRNHSNVYAGTSSGIARSTDGGSSWIGDAWTDGTVGALAINPFEPNILYAGSLSAGVFKSSNAGTSWSESGLKGIPVHGLVVDIQEPDTVYAATDQGPFKSVDAGRMWYRIGEGLTSIRAPVMSGDLPICRVYVGTDDGAFATDIGPVLTLHSNLCVGTAWTVVISHAPGNAPARLLGTSNGISWEIPNWGTTNGAGMLTASGAFPASAAGAHQLRVEVGGVPSNLLSFTVLNCRTD